MGHASPRLRARYSAVGPRGSHEDSLAVRVGKPGAAGRRTSIPHFFCGQACRTGRSVLLICRNDGIALCSARNGSGSASVFGHNRPVSNMHAYCIREVRQMTHALTTTLLWFSAIGCGLLAGLYFSFSAFIMLRSEGRRVGTECVITCR